MFEATSIPKQNSVAEPASGPKTGAYKNSVWRRVRRVEGQMFMQSYRPAGRGTWKMLPKDQCVVIPETTDPDAIGAALGLALERGRTFSG